MTSKTPTFEDILQAEANIQMQTYRDLRIWFINFGNAITVLLKIACLKLSLPDPESNEYRIIIRILDGYYQLPMALRSCSAQMERGFYTDSIRCCRSLLEDLVKFKFLLTNPDLVELYEVDGKDSNGDRVTVKRAWKFVAGSSEAHDKIYKPLSKFTHHNFGSSLPRLSAGLRGDKLFSTVPLYNPKLAGFIINFLTALVCGYMNLALRAHFFDWQLAISKTKKECQEASKSFFSLIEDNKRQFPESLDWWSSMEKLIS